MLQKNQCITKRAAKSTNRRTAKCHLLHGFFMYSITKAAAKKKWSGTTSLHTYRLIHYILTGAAMYHQRCGKKYQCSGVAPEVLPKVPTSVKVLTAQVLPKYRCTISAQLLPPHQSQVLRKKERNECGFSFLKCVLELSSERPGTWFGVLELSLERPRLYNS